MNSVGIARSNCGEIVLKNLSYSISSANRGGQRERRLTIDKLSLHSWIDPVSIAHERYLQYLIFLYMPFYCNPALAWCSPDSPDGAISQVLPPLQHWTTYNHCSVRLYELYMCTWFAYLSTHCTVYHRDAKYTCCRDHKDRNGAFCRLRRKAPAF